MKILQIFLLALFPLVSFSCSKGESGVGVIPPNTVKLGDPFILYHQGTYYAYGTNDPNGIEVFVSDDLKTWRRPVDSNFRLALKKDDVWADRWFWAPEVYFVNGKFYMYYSADEHICVATSDSPLGPFKQEVKRPMIESEKSIDNSLFIDDNGKPYIYFVRFNDGNNIWVAELTDDLMSVKMETMKKCMNVSQDWENVWPRVVEGPFVVKHKGVYYMTYSANSYESPFYGVGYATATSPMGPWIKYDKNPILQKPRELVGVGHSANFTDKDGKLRIVFHSHYDSKNIHPRLMHIGTIEFVESPNGDVMTVDKDILTPIIK